MNEDAQVAADARTEAIRSGCQDPEARRIVAVYATRRATPAISSRCLWVWTW
jgi:hypothetical protein